MTGRPDPARTRLEETEHAVLEPRTSDEWGHQPTCIECVLLRAAYGESTSRDYLLKDSTGRFILDQPRPVRLYIGNLRFQCPTCGVPVDVAEGSKRGVKLDPCGHYAAVSEDDDTRLVPIA